MKNFIGSRALPAMKYHCPRELKEALKLLEEAQGDCRIIAGCTDFIPAVRRGAWSFENGLDVIDVRRIDGQDSIKRDGETIRIGAATRLTDIVESPIVRKHVFFLSEAIQDMASLQIRNRATIGGNLCTASPAADTAPPLLALDANVKIKGANKEELVPLKDFFVGPGRTMLGPMEMITEVQFPVLKPNEKTFRMKLGRRDAFTLSVVSVATWIRIKDRKFDGIRIALGAVAPTPLRAEKTEAFLIGKGISEEIIEAGAKMACEEASPISDVRASAAYRKDMIYVLTRKALMASLK